ncbi:MAG: cell wall hydrolase [Lachnospiraceae bacterium]|nr:cell wall hydrolase [Lachnospiraceae bacterium]
MKKLLISAAGVAGGILIVCSAFLCPVNGREPSAETTVKSEPTPEPVEATPIATETLSAPTPELTRKPSVFSKKDRYLLMKIAMAEAEDEDTEGKALVMRVVLNRVRHKEFPDSIKKVIYQEKQFSPIASYTACR